MNGGLAAKGLAQRHAAGAAKIREQNADCRRGEFLRAIDAGTENLSDFEMNFIESFLGARALVDRALDFQWFTPARRRVVDGMIQRYGMRSLKFEGSAARQPIPQAEAGHCGYLIEREGRRNQPCGEPAVFKLQSGLELCATHDQERKENLERLRQFKLRNMR